jgi:MFS family permease
MATLDSEDSGTAAQLQVTQPRLRWTQILAISIFSFAFNFHWAALGLIIIPSQVFKLVGNLDKGTALAIVLVPGAFIALVSNPFFGWLSDHTTGWLARWGSRRPYILIGTLVNIVTLAWMASARSIPSLAFAYAFTQLSSNAAQAPFHALLPDLVPAEQRGLTSGVMGLLLIAGNIGGVIVAGLYINATNPLPIYQHYLWLTYGIIMAILFVLMLVTIFSVRERALRSRQQIAIEQKSAIPRQHVFRLPRPVQITLATTLLAALLVWGLMVLWNTFQGPHLQINATLQQVILEVVVTVGILRLFDFHPRRTPDFAWVLATRLLVMLGIYTIQTFLQYYMLNVVGVADPEQATTNFVILVSLTSLFSAFIAGWLSDHLGRKRLVYVAGYMMALVGVIFVVTHSYVIVFASAALFGLGYGAYQSVDWALVVDVLPSEHNYARDMGVWNIAASLAQVVAPVLGGPLIDAFTRAGHPVLGFQLLFVMAIIYCVLGTFTVRFIRSVRN